MSKVTQPGLGSNEESSGPWITVSSPLPAPPTHVPLYCPFILRMSRGRRKKEMSSPKSVSFMKVEKLSRVPQEEGLGDKTPQSEGTETGVPGPLGLREEGLGDKTPGSEEG